MELELNPIKEKEHTFLKTTSVWELEKRLVHSEPAVMLTGELGGRPAMLD